MLRSPDRERPRRFSVRASNESTISDILAGKQHVVSSPRHGQSPAGSVGNSACSLAAFNCARIVLQREASGQSGKDLLASMLARETMDEILDVYYRWISSAHIEAEDIHAAPVFKHSLLQQETKFESLGLQQFRDLLKTLLDTSSRAVAAVITRSPEVVAVLGIPCEGTHVFVVFDSKPRTAHPHGAGFVINTSLDATAEHLHKLLQLGTGILEDPSLQWQARLLAKFSAHIYTAATHITDPDRQVEMVLESSLAALAYKADVARLEARVKALEAENKRLRTANYELEHRVERADMGHGPPLTSQTPSNGGGPSSGRRSTLSSVQSSNATSRPTPSSKVDHPRSKLFGADTSKATPPPPIPSVLCTICIDEFSPSSLVKFEPCEHGFCQECTRSHARATLENRRYPVPCPICSVGTNVAHSGVLEGPALRRMDLSATEADILTELELAAFSVVIHCRRCEEEIFVDKQEYQQAIVISCPIPNCIYVWCKTCSQPIEFDGPPHSCDGTSELSTLMGQRGWKFCPGCRTPTEKIEGCNHMTCMSPGCNVHFCYVCGDLIIQSVQRTDIRRAVSQHYASCRLFEAAARRGVQRA